MKNKKGFTLTEVLLAVMIVGLIAVALASLTRGAARESGAGRSKVMLRNNLSTFMRRLRSDLTKANFVTYISGARSDSGALITMVQNGDRDGHQITDKPVSWVTYCFTKGNTSCSGGQCGGKISRVSGKDCTSSGENVLMNVKYLNNGEYISPLFARHGFSRKETNSLLKVQIIVELDSKPVINDVVEETFAMPNGY